MIAAQLVLYVGLAIIIGTRCGATGGRRSRDSTGERFRRRDSAREAVALCR